MSHLLEFLEHEIVDVAETSNVDYRRFKRFLLDFPASLALAVSLPKVNRTQFPAYLSQASSSRRIVPCVL